MSALKRLIIGITGASGVIYGIRMLEALQRDQDVETHLVLSKASRAAIAEETEWTVGKVEALADVVHHPQNVGASIASGSFKTSGMMVAPCSVKTLSGIANCYDSNLITRAADVQLKEGRPVLLLLRETPLHLGHLRLMTFAAEQGAVIMPPVPVFYDHPQSINDIINGTVGRALMRLGIENDLYVQWDGIGGRGQDSAETKTTK